MSEQVSIDTLSKLSSADVQSYDEEPFEDEQAFQAILKLASCSYPAQATTNAAKRFIVYMNDPDHMTDENLEKIYRDFRAELDSNPSLGYENDPTMLTTDTRPGLGRRKSSSFSVASNDEYEKNSKELEEYEAKKAQRERLISLLERCKQCKQSIDDTASEIDTLRSAFEINPPNKE
ncbi:uncharacterized protein L201_007165 [Kwoniella dendrophila CBS 6074]|uniref:BZIP domain-containing protein n=1 Tax=Kwoniella dendrophila CBS 6074 TaxID=1295534 RepID=A0AAX4K3N6_9TREE